MARALGHHRRVPPFRKPAFAYDYDVDRELEALRTYPKRPDRRDRAIPPKARGHLLVATWNIANLGLQRRDDRDYRLLAEVLGWFDLVAIQEVSDDLRGLRAIQRHLPARYRVQFNDAGGNRERFAFLYDSEKVAPSEEVGEVTVTPIELDRVRLAHVAGRFAGFDRNPMIASFEVDRTMLLLASVHLYFGAARPATACTTRSSARGCTCPRTRRRWAARTSTETRTTTRWPCSPAPWSGRSSGSASSTSTGRCSATCGATARRRSGGGSRATCASTSPTTGRCGCGCGPRPNRS
jgi:hypothetical protein